MKDQLEGLMKHLGNVQANMKEMQEKLIHMDILHRRSFGRAAVGFYGQKLMDKLRRR